VTRLAILDRDGTVIDVVRDEEAGAVTVAFHPSQIRFLAGAIEGMRALRDAGYVLALATNQPGPAKGQFSVDAVRRTNAALEAQLEAHGVPLAAVEACLHHPDGGTGGDASLVKRCDCRKPGAAMIESLLSRLGADRESTWMIGDSVTDVQAGAAARVKTGLVFSTSRCELCPLRGGPHSARPDVHGASLVEIAAAILARH
jgi:D-glycero-D-manno-heptose 1,7-bisphosphate phosphatase